MTDLLGINGNTKLSLVKVTSLNKDMQSLVKQKNIDQNLDGLLDSEEIRAYYRHLSSLHKTQSIYHNRLHIDHLTRSDMHASMYATHQQLSNNYGLMSEDQQASVDYFIATSPAVSRVSLDTPAHRKMLLMDLGDIYIEGTLGSTNKKYGAVIVTENKLEQYLGYSLLQILSDYKMPMRLLTRGINDNVFEVNILMIRVFLKAIKEKEPLIAESIGLFNYNALLNVASNLDQNISANDRLWFWSGEHFNMMMQQHKSANIIFTREFLVKTSYAKEYFSISVDELKIKSNNASSKRGGMFILGAFIE